MKDWRKSPELPAMMGGLSREADTSISSESQPLQESLLPQKPKVLSSLADMARKVIIQRIHLYDTLGDAPYQLVRPILEQCPPRKLCSFEEESPHLSRDTGPIWKRNCLRDFRDITDLQKANAEAHLFGWKELYMRRVQEDMEAKQAATAKIKEKYAVLKADKQASQVRVVAPPPVRRKVSRNAVNSPPGKMTQGQRMLSKARKQAQNQSVVTKHSNSQRQGLNISTGSYPVDRSEKYQASSPNAKPHPSGPMMFKPDARIQNGSDRKHLHSSHMYEGAFGHDSTALLSSSLYDRHTEDANDRSKRAKPS